MTNMSLHKTTSSYDGGGDSSAFPIRFPLLDRAPFVMDDDFLEQHRVYSLLYKYLKSRTKPTQAKINPNVCNSKL